MYLPDSSVICELRKAGDGKADANVVSSLSSWDAATFYLTAVTLMEIELGILRIERQDPTEGARLRVGIYD